MSKLRAFLVHLGLSAAIVGAVCATIFLVWYPHPYFAAKGAWDVLRVLVGVDLVLGPTLTLLLFKPQKPGLLFDLSVIASIQLSALLYGTTVIYQERPYFAVFAVDRFQVLARRDVDASQIGADELSDKPLAGPILAVAVLPEDPKEFQALLEEVLFENKPDIERRPEYWHPYSSRSADVLARGQSLTDLAKARPESRERIEAIIASMHSDGAEPIYVPLVGRGRDFTFIIDGETARPIEIIDVDPWLDSAGPAG